MEEGEERNNGLRKGWWGYNREWKGVLEIECTPTFVHGRGPRVEERENRK